MKRPTRWPLTKKEKQKYKGWIVYYNSRTNEILHMEKVKAKRRNINKIKDLFKPTCKPPCKKQPCPHRQDITGQLIK